VDHRRGVGVLIDQLVEGELAGGGELPLDRGAVQVVDTDQLRREGVVGVAGGGHRHQVADPDAEVARGPDDQPVAGHAPPVLGNQLTLCGQAHEIPSVVPE